MKIHVIENERKIVKTIADRLEAVICSKPDALVCIAAGYSPVMLMKLLAEDAEKKVFPVERLRYISLDEWIGLGRENKGSCIYDIGRYLLEPLGIPQGDRLFFFDGKTEDMGKECADAEAFLEKNGPIDVMVLGIGMNGHIGFNEPGTPFNSTVQTVRLDETSRTVGRKYFDKEYRLSLGITLGMKQILEARKVFLIAMGKKKASVVLEAFGKEPSEKVPASILQLHPSSEVFLDPAAASLLPLNTINEG